jgi:hypothetical protein
MPRERIALGIALSIGGLLVQNTASAQDYRGTLEQQLACTPDVWRLCSDQVPDVNRIVACLRQNTPLLSRSCRAVFESNAATQQPSQPGWRGRDVPTPNGTQPQPRAVPPQQPQPNLMQPPPRYDDDD